jgi:Uma2 family endonuclease
MWVSRPGETLYCPDVAFVTTERDQLVGGDEFFPYAPDIAIEVWSPDNTEAEMATKAAHYLAYGSRAVWILRRQDRTLCVYHMGVTVQTLSGEDRLTEEILPGFSVRAGDLFPA